MSDCSAFVAVITLLAIYSVNSVTV